MNLLLDTHALLWLFDDDDRLSANAKETIRPPRHFYYRIFHEV